MLLVLFLIFLVTPVVEIAVFIKVGGLIGTQATIAIVLVNAVLGAVLLRRQGVSALRRAHESLERGEPPVAAALDGVGLIVAGALMITPGLVTDAIGFLLLIPPVRRWIVMSVFRYLARSSLVHIQVFGSPQGGGPARPGPGFRHNETVIDADYEVMDEPPGQRREKPGHPEPGEGGSEATRGKGPHTTRR